MLRQEWKMTLDPGELNQRNVEQLWKREKQGNWWKVNN